MCFLIGWPLKTTAVEVSGLSVAPFMLILVPTLVQIKDKNIEDYQYPRRIPKRHIFLN